MEAIGIIHESVPVDIPQTPTFRHIYAHEHIRMRVLNAQNLSCRFIHLGHHHLNMKTQQVDHLI